MTVEKNKALFAALFSLVLATTMLFISFTSPVWAEDSDDDSAPNKAEYLLRAHSSDEEHEGHGVHKDPATFQKNFCLSVDQKEYAITGIEDVVDKNITSGMSDLEKYYTLAIAGNQIVEYDWQFWGGGYDFDYYSHQWDSYGAMNPDEKSVCVGMAIFYSHLCHAAGLPCKFVRLDPDYLDHTISYIPDINGNAYYVDITENVFVMSEKSINSYEPNVDKNCDFAKIPKLCTDASFDYYDEDADQFQSTDIKECYDVPYADWYKEYALHEGTDKKFGAEYVEKGSGTDPDLYHASYHDYPSNFVEQTDVWFLDDFYENPAEIKEKILSKQFDDQLLSISGIKKNYDYASVEELEANIVNDISRDIAVRYFPSMENGEVVAKADELAVGTDYKVLYTGYDEATKTAHLTVEALEAGGYTGIYPIEVKINSAVVSKDPVFKKGLVYSGKAQALIEPGEAECGEMQYALGTKDGPTGAFTTAIPTATNAGKYFVWYKAVGDANHESSEPKCMEPVAKIAPITVEMTVNDTININIGETAKITPKIDKKVQAKFTFVSDNEDVATVDDNGVVTGVGGGFTTIEVNADLANTNYKVFDSGWVGVEVEGAIDIDDTRVVLSQTSFTYNGKVQKPTIKKIKRRALKEGTDYTAKWSNASSKNAGTYTVVITGEGSYFGTTDATYTIKKAPNSMKLKAKTVKVKRKALKKKAKTIKRAKAFTVSKAKGKLSYKLVSAKKGKKNFKKKFKVDAKTGKIKLKKGLKKGTYKVKVKVTAKGSANYKAGAKTVTFKVKVK